MGSFTRRGGLLPAASPREIVLQPLVQEESYLQELSKRLVSLADGYGISLGVLEARRCVDYLLYVLQVNTFINLTSVRDVDDALVLHLLDSLLFCTVAPGDAHRFLDMGTGGGFPGVPFHFATGCQGTLVDSVAKKVRAVSTILQEMGIDGLEGKQARLEELAVQEPSSYDLVFARALAPLPTLVEYAAPFLVHGGVFIASKGKPDEEELVRGNRAAKLCGLDLMEKRCLELPNDQGVRTLLVYQCTSRPSVKLPRAVGLAKKSPLA